MGNFLDSMFHKKNKEEMRGAPAASDSGAVRKGPTLLVVDDEEALRTMMKDLLESKGYHVLLAADGKAGLDETRAKKPDLVILDVNMPKMDGFTVLSHLKKDKKTMNIPIIMLTTRTEQEDIAKGIENYADKYLPKPFQPQNLLEEIEKTLSLR